jgi:hypothetical protein
MADDNARWRMPEDANERRMFDDITKTLGGRPLRVVANALSIMSRTAPQEGSYAKQLAIYANECLKADEAAVT